MRVLVRVHVYVPMYVTVAVAMLLAITASNLGQLPRKLDRR
jgi:hypothetical protein